MSLDKDIATIEDILEDAKNGKMVILIDDEGRENEGDLVIPAQFIDGEKVNFMAKHARGLICLSLTKARADVLDLKPMVNHNQSQYHTAFTISIEAREGVTTGISAYDRARTIQVAIDDKKTKNDILHPGHVFPLIAQEEGVLVRNGHTEASVDIAKLAGLNPSAVICEIMNDDGTMARLDDLKIFAQIHDLKIGTIEDLVQYRQQQEKRI